MKNSVITTYFFQLSVSIMIIIIISMPLKASELRIGIETGWLEKFYLYDYPVTESFTHEHYDNTELSIFADWEYFRGSIGYSKHVLSYVYDNGDEEKKYNNYDISFLNIIALIKYPFSFNNEKIKLWPAIGLEYDYNIKYTKDGEDLTGKYNELDDIYLQGGTGMDYNLSMRLALTCTFLTGINLTPRPGDSSSIGSNFMGLNSRLLVGFSYSI